MCLSMCTCMCMCMSYVCLVVCMCMYVSVCVNVYMRTYVYVGVCMCMYVCACACMCMSVYVCMYVYVCVCMCVCMSACMSVCPYVCMYVCIRNTRQTCLDVSLILLARGLLHACPGTKNRDVCIRSDVQYPRGLRGLGFQGLGITLNPKPRARRNSKLLAPVLPGDIQLLDACQEIGRPSRVEVGAMKRTCVPWAGSGFTLNPKTLFETETLPIPQP